MNQHKDLYFLTFEHGACYAKSCYECPFRSGSAADLRLGDYWHTKYANDKSGVSMVSAFTNAGRDFMEQLKKHDAGRVLDEPLHDYYECQQTGNVLRPLFWEEMSTALKSEGSLENIADKYVLPFEKSLQIKSQAPKRFLPKKILQTAGRPKGNTKKLPQRAGLKMCSE